MARLAGYGGAVDWTGIVPNATAYGVHSWSCDIVCDMLDVTDFDSSGNRQFIRGLKSWSGSIELKIDGTNTVVPSDIGSSAALKLYLSDTLYLSGTALCGGGHPSVSVDGEETMTLDFQGTGALAFSDL